MHTIGTSGGWLGSNSPGLALEYVRRAVVAEARRPTADVVVAASHFIPDAAAVHAAARRGVHGVAFVYHLVAGREDRSLRTRWSQLDEGVALRLLRRTGCTLFSSNVETIDALRARGLDARRTDVGLDLRAFRRANILAAGPVILFLARLVPKKGLLDLIAAMPEILRAVPDARLVIAGSGPQRAEAEARSAQLGVAGALDWRGFVTEEEKHDLLAHARVFAAPSYEEGWGISVAEAMASGLPVVAYRLPTLDEVFGDAYAAVDVGSTSDLAKAIVNVLVDDSAAMRRAGRGVDRVAPYDVNAIARKELDTILADAAGSG